VAVTCALLLIAGAGFAGGGLLARASSSGGGVLGGNPRYPGATMMSDGVPKPSVQLVDTSGRPYDLARETVGKVTLVYFGYTHCPDLCPMNMALAAGAVRDLPPSIRQKVTVVFITTDPRRDTEPVIRRWLDKFDPAFVGLTGSINAIHLAEREVAMPMSYAETVSSKTPMSMGGDYQVVHAGYTLLYPPNGRAFLQFDANDHPAQVATTIEHLLTKPRTTV
jgi:protein SCO1/2